MKKSLLICILAVMLCVSMLFAACAPSLEAATLESMKELLYQMYKDSNPANTYEVVSVVASSGERANVQWSVNVTAGNTNDVKLGKNENNKQTIEIEPYPAQDVAYTLTATLVNEKGVAYKIDGEPVSISFERSLTKFVLNTYEEYLAAATANNGSGSGEQIRIKGYVIGVVCMESSSKGSLYIQDADGHGYYAYAPAGATEGCETTEQLRAKWPVGTEVIVTGTVVTYNGQYEFEKDCTLIVTGNTATDAQLPYVDATSAFAAAETNQDTALAAYQNRRVQLKDATITSVDIQLNADGTYNKVYYYFTLPGSDVEFNVYYTIYFIDEATMLELHDKLEVGTKVDLTGVVSVYSKAFQIYPDSANSVSNIREITYTDAEKVQMAKDNLVIVDSAKEGDELELPAEGALDTTITWALAEGQTYDFATLADGKLTITATPSSTTKIQLVATITSGSESATKTFEVTVAGATFELINFAQAVELCGTTKDKYTEDKYYMMGTIKEVTNTTYGNMTIVDENGTEFTLYGTYSADGSTRYDAMANAPVAGDVIVVYGKLGYYNAPQMKNGWIIASYDVKTFAEAVELCGTTKDKYTEDKYYMVGTIKEVTNTTYGNMTIVDENGTEFTLYGTYDATGANRYDAMTNAPVAGNVIVVYGKLGYYNAPQMKNGWIVVVAPAGVAQETPAHTCESKCPTCQGCLDAACTETVCATKCAGHEGGEQGGESGGEVNPPVGEATTVSVALNTTANKVSADANALVFAKDGVTITVNKATSTSDLVDKTGDGYAARVYKGATLTVAANQITKIVITCDSYTSNGTTYYSGFDGMSVAGATITRDELVITITFATPVNTFTSEAVSSQVRIMSIDVFCAASEGGESGGESGGEVNPPAHTCTSVCATCNKCTDTACTETVCADKCEGHTAPSAITSIAEALTAADGSAVELTGTVTGHYNGYKSNFYIQDEAGNSILVYYATSNTEIGDVVKVVGTLGSFNGTKQVAQGSTVTVITAHECSEFTTATCTAAELCVVCGEVKAGSTALGHTAPNGEGKCDTCGADLDTSSGWILVTDVSTLAAGDQIVIVAKDANYALGTNQKSNNRDIGTVTKDGSKVILGSDVQVITLEAGASAGTFAFNVGNGYLYAASSSSNYLKTSSTIGTGASWTITIDGNGVATIKGNQTNKNWLRYNPNNGSPLFSCYSSGQGDVCIYKLVGSAQ